MTQLHSSHFLLGIKDPNIKITKEMTEEPYFQVLSYRPSRKRIDLKEAYRKVIAIEGVLDCLPHACAHCGHTNEGPQDIIRNGKMKTAILIGQYNFQPVYLKLKNNAISVNIAVKQP
ncbi:hypothetical protein HZY86_06670 [Aerococcaceae bacterium DSM 111020]|nr:hypothetical protein [Aerococcaceae bacterium DSM 111020]